MIKAYIENQKWDEDDQGFKITRPTSLEAAMEPRILQAASAASRLSVLSSSSPVRSSQIGFYCCLVLESSIRRCYGMSISVPDVAFTRTTSQG